MATVDTTAVIDRVGPSLAGIRSRLQIDQLSDEKIDTYLGKESGFVVLRK